MKLNVFDKTSQTEMSGNTQSGYYYVDKMHKNGELNASVLLDSKPGPEVKSDRSSQYIQCVLPFLCLLQVISIVSVSVCFVFYKATSDECTSLQNEMRHLQHEYLMELLRVRNETKVDMTRLRNDTRTQILRLQEEMEANLTAQIRDLQHISRNLSKAKADIYDYDPEEEFDEAEDGTEIENESETSRPPPLREEEGDEEEEEPDNLPPTHSIRPNLRPSLLSILHGESEENTAAAVPSNVLSIDVQNLKDRLNFLNDKIESVIGGLNSSHPTTAPPSSSYPDSTTSSSITNYPTTDPSTFSYPTTDPSTFTYPTTDSSTFSYPTTDPSGFSYPTTDLSTFSYPTTDPSGFSYPTTDPSTTIYSELTTTTSTLELPADPFTSSFEFQEDEPWLPSEQRVTRSIKYDKKDPYAGVNPEKNDAEGDYRDIEEPVRHKPTRTMPIIESLGITVPVIDTREEPAVPSRSLATLESPKNLVLPLMNQSHDKVASQNISPLWMDHARSWKQMEEALQELRLTWEISQQLQTSTSEDKTSNTIAIHLVGDTSKPRQLREKHYNVNHRMYHPKGHIKDWKIDPKVSQDKDNNNTSRHFKLENGHLRVKKAGLYFVYSQIYYSTKEDTSGFNIFLNDDVMMRCITTGVSSEQLQAQHDTAPNSCYTAGLMRIDTDDHLSIKETQGERYTIFEPTRSFFGLFKVV